MNKALILVLGIILLAMVIGGAINRDEVNNKLRLQQVKIEELRTAIQYHTKVLDTHNQILTEYLNKQSTNK